MQGVKFVRLKYQKMIGFILVICMLFSGVCLEITKADSVSAYSVESHPVSQISSVQKKIINSDSCTIEMLGFRNASGVIGGAKQFSGNWEVNASLFLVYVDNLYQSMHNFSVAINIPQFPELYPKAVVLNYIHNKDGKK